MLKDYTQKLETIVSELKNCETENDLILNSRQIDYIDDLEDWTDKVQSPLQHLEHKLHSWVAYLIMPLFALANAGIVFNFESGVDINIILTIAASLFIGNAIGIPIMTMIGVKLRLTEFPDGMRPRHLFGVAFLAGVGFTMSIFISNLAFVDNPILVNSAKIGILAGSVLSGISSYLLLRFTAGSKDHQYNVVI
jgi:NhaA family Na+:H+ antiporter